MIFSLVLCQKKLIWCQTFGTNFQLFCAQPQLPLDPPPPFASCSRPPSSPTIGAAPLMGLLLSDSELVALPPCPYKGPVRPYNGVPAQPPMTTIDTTHTHPQPHLSNHMVCCMHRGDGGVACLPSDPLISPPALIKVM